MYLQPLCASDLRLRWGEESGLFILITRDEPNNVDDNAYCNPIHGGNA